MNSNTILINGILYKTGDKITCHINGDYIEDAVIHVDFGGAGNKLYAHICQNVHNGDEPEDCLGYEYGWLFYINEYLNGNSDVADIKKLHPKNCFEDIVESAFPSR